MTKQYLENIKYEAYDRMVKQAEKLTKLASREPVTNQMVTKTLENLLKEIK